MGVGSEGRQCLQQPRVPKCQTDQGFRKSSGPVAEPLSVLTPGAMVSWILVGLEWGPATLGDLPRLAVHSDPFPSPSSPAQGERHTTSPIRTHQAGGASPIPLSVCAQIFSEELLEKPVGVLQLPQP